MTRPTAERGEKRRLTPEIGLSTEKRGFSTSMVMPGLTWMAEAMTPTTTPAIGERRGQAQGVPAGVHHDASSPSDVVMGPLSPERAEGRGHHRR